MKYENQKNIAHLSAQSCHSKRTWTIEGGKTPIWMQLNYANEEEMMWTIQNNPEERMRKYEFYSELLDYDPYC